MPQSRPNPDHLLQRITEEERQEHHGKLKIYLGASPGVGKTHEMLHDAYEKKQQGLDVVIGIAESHGREEIESFLHNFEIIPRKPVPYREKTYDEFDLDAALQRHPGLILVDELAHTNTPGLRHAKRWQDIKELLERGIDVYTTLNIQHIESLKDDVAQIIHAPIIETVPDSMIERADTIELVDLPPEDLLKRLQEGKIYIPQQAEFAREHFFRKGNLIALRELALRVTAERVGSDVLWYRHGEGVKEIWPIKDKILVCVGPNPETMKLIRAAKKLATHLQAEWVAVYIDIPQKNSGARGQAIKNLRLAELLGAQTHVLSGFDIVKEILRFAHEQNITQIMIWKHIRTRIRDWFYRNLTDEIVRQSGDIDIYIITGHNSKSASPKTKAPLRKRPWKVYGLAVVVLPLITLFNFALEPYLDTVNLIMIYLLGVTFISLCGRRGPALFASLFSVIMCDYFFISPRYSFAISDIQFFITLIIMLVVSQTISYLTILLRHQEESSRFTQHQTTALYAFSRQLIRSRSIKKLLNFGVEYIAHTFDSDVMALMPKKNQLAVQVSFPASMRLDAKEQSIAQWVFDMGQPAGMGTDTLSLSKALYLPLASASGVIGVLRVQSKDQQLFTPEQRGLLDSYVNQMSLALEIDLLHEKNRKKELEMERDRARISLLTSIYHDLSFPLKSVTNVINGLKNNRKAKLSVIESNMDHEINKLNHLNNNLYQMICLETEGVNLKKALCSLEEIIEAALKISSELFEKRPIKLTIPEHMPLINVDAQYIQEVLMHLLDNAIKFSDPKSQIRLSAQITTINLIVSIENMGLEIDAAEQDELFKKFYRSKEALEEHGLGLGLSICEKIISAHQGTIWVENLPSKGAVFRFALPIK
ncbi:sensor histidine kinase [Legionella saoudiensis]|uniref:sensor histidine kinase n=1 Tax=Legionella saoudiensis TaxID=1750561 RepID=UPI00072FEB21|nr:sensor histidine kinase KdpD [Legionella saoudiensis]